MICWASMWVRAIITANVGPCTVQARNKWQTDILGCANFFIFNLSWFSKNNRSKQNFVKVYIWRCGLQRLEFLPPWATAAGESPTVGSTGWWGQDLRPRRTASANPSAVGRGVRNMPPWAAAAAPAHIRGRAHAFSPTPPSLSLTPPSKSSAFNLFGALLRYIF
jgi:hypothetical protein